jgi:AraC-like DNA-binding protein
MPIEYQQQDYFPLKSLAVSIFRRRIVSAVLPHFHAFDELIFVLSGRGQHVVDGASLNFRSGDVLLVPAGCSHHYRNVCGLTIACLLIRPSQLIRTSVRNSYEACPGLMNHIPSHVRPSARIFLQMQKWIQIIEEQKWPESEQALTLLLSAVASSNRCPLVAACQHFHATMMQRLAPGLHYLESHFADENPLEPICDLVHMSRRTLLRRFHEITGRNPVSYLSDLRLHHSMLEMRRTKRSILTIAMDAGYNDLSYFHRRFHKATGLSPLSWRKNPAHVW